MGGGGVQNRQLHNIRDEDGSTGCECCRVMVIQFPLAVSVFKFPVGPVLVIKGIGFQTGVKGA